MLLTIAINQFESKSGQKCVVLNELQVQLRGAPKARPRNVYKTDVL